MSSPHFFQKFKTCLCFSHPNYVANFEVEWGCISFQMPGSPAPSASSSSSSPADCPSHLWQKIMSKVEGGGRKKKLALLLPSAQRRKMGRRMEEGGGGGRRRGRGRGRRRGRRRGRGRGEGRGRKPRDLFNATKRVRQAKPTEFSLFFLPNLERKKKKQTFGFPLATKNKQKSICSFYYYDKLKTNVQIFF